MLFLFFIIQGYSQNSFWIMRADFGGHAMGAAASFSNDTVGYVLPGNYKDDSTHSYVYPNQLWQYNPAHDVWTRKADFPGIERWGGVCFTIGTKAYYGLTDGAVPDFWEYDLIADSWRRLDSFPGGDRRYSISFKVGGRGYAGLGVKDVPGPSSDIWEYDQSQNSWIRKADYPGVGIIFNTVFVIRDTAYIGMGQYLSPNLERDFWRYEAATDTWTRRADFPGINSIGASCFVKDGKAYVCSGADSNYVTHHDVWEYDPLADAWHQIDSFPGRSRDYGVGFTVGGRAFIGLGNTEYNSFISLKDFWEFDPDTTLSGFDEAMTSSISLFPNPTNEKLYLNVVADVITISDITGRSYDVPHTGREIDVSGLASGVYVLRLQSREGSVVRRFVRE